MKKISITFICLAVECVVCAQGTHNRLYANVTGAASWTDIETAPYGIYELPLGGSNDLTMQSHEVVPANFGAVLAGGRYFVANGLAYGEMVFVTNYIYYADTWQKITDFEGKHYNIADMAWDETTGNVYGYFTHLVTFDSFFGTISMETGRINEISRPEYRLKALGCHANGTLYGITDEGLLCRIDKSTGQIEEIGKTGCVSTYSTSGAVLSRENRFYYATCSDTETALYAIDLNTAEATKLYDMPDGEEIRGMFFTGPSATDKAPGEITGLTVNFNDDALSGTYNFTLPPTLFDGTAGNGDVEYVVSLDKTPIATAKAPYGSAISGDISVDGAGMHTLEVRAINDAGHGPTASLSAWIGDDLPAPVTSLTVNYDGKNKITLEWDPAKALHGGYFIDTDVTYNVTRFPEEISVSGITECSFTDDVPQPDADGYATYYYMVTAVYHGKKSSSVISPSYTIGSVAPPFKEEFDNRWDLGKFTIIDGNGDNERWNWVSKSVTLLAGHTAADDYLILPPLMFEAGWTYRFSVDAHGKYASDTERFEVLMGHMADIQALQTTIMEPVDVKSIESQNFTADFAVTVSEACFIAVHGISDPYQGALTIDNISVTPVKQSSSDTAFTERASVKGLSGGILVATPSAIDVCVHAASGIKVYGDKVNGTVFIPLSKGIYVFTTTDTNIKVVVK